MSLWKIAGRVRGLFAGNYTENDEDQQFHLNTRGDQIVAQGLPPLTELSRLGDSWQVMTSTAQAALTGLPTTTAGLSLWNGEQAGGAGAQKCYVIDSVAAVEIVVDATQQNELALFVMNNKTPVTAPTDAALTIRSVSGRSYGGKARTLAAGTVTNDGWFPVGNSSPGSAAVAGGVWRTTDVPINGLHIIQPGGMFNVVGVKAAATASQLHFVIRWHEMLLFVRNS